MYLKIEQERKKRIINYLCNNEIQLIHSFQQKGYTFKYRTTI